MTIFGGIDLQIYIHLPGFWPFWPILTITIYKSARHHWFIQRIISTLCEGRTHNHAIWQTYPVISDGKKISVHAWAWSCWRHCRHGSYFKLKVFWVHSVSYGHSVVLSGYFYWIIHSHGGEIIWTAMSGHIWRDAWQAWWFWLILVYFSVQNYSFFPTFGSTPPVSLMETNFQKNTCAINTTPIIPYPISLYALICFLLWFLITTDP